MAKFPVEITDNEGVIEAVNYLLSGPAGLGQNFSGFSSYTSAYLTGNFRIPYTQSKEFVLYVSPIQLSKSEMLDGRTWKFTFDTEQTSPPFTVGNNIAVRNVTNDLYNGDYIPIGVTECTTTYVICRTSTVYEVQAASTGGFVYNASGNDPLSTDCLARVTVNGGTDRVFISSQLNNVLSYEIFSEPATLTYTVQLRRFAGVPNNDPVNPDYVFINPVTIAERIYTYANLTGSGTLDERETIFTTIIDQPAIGFYKYILEVTYEFGTYVPATFGGQTNTRNKQKGQILTSKFGLRSLSAQVVKQ
jgi:hypothetical protein